MAGKSDPQIGARIRKLRLQRRLSQTDLAAALGISISYLNLIEHNRRKITVPLLFKLAGYFGVEPADLVDGDEARIVGDLMEMFGEELFAESDLTNHDIRDFAHSNPAVARAILHLYDRYRALESHSQTEPEMLAGDGPPFHLATDRISDFIQENANYFPTLEAAAERVRTDIDHAAEEFEGGLKSYLSNVFGIDWRLASLPSGIARKLEPASGRLLVSDILPPESAVFAAAHQLGLLAAVREIDAIVAEASLPEGDAPDLARNALAAYFAAALIMPYAPFHRMARDYRYDIERLARRFGASFEQVCHRLTSLQRPGMQGIPLHLVRTDIAGNISKRFSLSGIQIPRHSGACPRWNVYAAFLQPDRINIQISEMPSGEQYFCIARTITKGDYRHNAPRRHFAIGIGCAMIHAREMVYADGFDLANSTHMVPIGVGCRICPRMECGQRAHPPANHRFRLDEAIRPESLYTMM
ncbi:helix-turn-helix domain-containing protein [Oceanibaculum nanhaiense]|uniref:helix-turn-helix domain-containing protein n=1 Tax=Oceanibaculum nanhaiense TaxID=1909734 RepID=UPI003D2AF33D